MDVLSNPSDVLVLRSCDNVDFPVCRAVLCMASTFFNNMISHPHPSTMHPSDNVVPLTEESYVLKRLVSWCDPLSLPMLDSVEDAALLIAPLDKYMMEGLRPRISKQVEKDFLATDSFSVWAFAVWIGDENLAGIAARRVIKIPQDDWLDTRRLPFNPCTSLKHISAEALQKLYVYRRCCGQAAKKKMAMDEILNSVLLSVQVFPRAECCRLASAEPSPDGAHLPECRLSVVATRRPPPSPQEAEFCWEDEQWQDYSDLPERVCYPSWLFGYLKEAENQVFDRPSMEALQGIPVWAEKHISPILSCAVCRSDILSRLQMFNVDSGRVIESAVDNVSVPTFCT